MPERIDRSGVYSVRESGLEYRHPEQEVPTPKDGKEFISRFRNNFELNILSHDEYDMVFELIGCDTSFANALRRILLAEIPTVALECVYMWNNTSLIHDEVLSHRLGLVPLNIDARLFDVIEESEEATDRNTVVFQMKVRCPAKVTNPMNDTEAGSLGEDAVIGDDVELETVSMAASKKEAIETPDRPYTKHVYSKDLQWMPQGDQDERFPHGIRPVHDDILLAKLRPGQEIELEAHGRVGIGRDHAKFSPVSTACYRLYTDIELLEPVYDGDAEELVHIYEPGVFQLVPASVPGKRVEAKLCNPYASTMSRNYMRNKVLANALKMSRRTNHFIFSVESVGMHPPGVLVAEAIRILQRKCGSVIGMTKDQEE